MFASLAQIFKPNQTMTTNNSQPSASTATGSSASTSQPNDRPAQLTSNLFSSYQKPNLNQILIPKHPDGFLNFSQPYRLNEKRNYRLLLNQHLKQKSPNIINRPVLNLLTGSSSTLTGANYRRFPYATSSLFNFQPTNRVAALAERLKSLQENDQETDDTNSTFNKELYKAISSLGTTENRSKRTSKCTTPAKSPIEEMEIDENYFGGISKGTSIVSISETWENLELDPDLPESVRKYKELLSNYEAYKQQNTIDYEQMHRLVQNLKKDEAKLRECRDKCRQHWEDISQISKDRKAQSVSITKLRYCPPSFELQSLDDDEDSYKIFGSDEEDLWEEEEEQLSDKEDFQEIDLPDHVLDKVRKILSIPDMNAAITDKYNSDIRRKDLETLQGANWLNDEVINFYFNMIAEREDKRVYCFNTFFLTKLRESGHKALRRWTKKVDIFSYELILIPVHLGMHWTLASIDFRTKEINYYDSMAGNNNECLNLLLQYLCDESLDKRKQPFDTTGWKLTNVKGIPQQGNGSDCGMFTCKYADYLSRGKKFTFSQMSMPYFRTRLTYEIITGEFLN